MEHDIEQTFICTTCTSERSIEDLPRVTLTICDGETTHPFSVLMCKFCARTLLAHLHANHCSQDCAEPHEYNG